MIIIVVVIIIKIQIFIQGNAFSEFADMYR